MPDAGPAGRVPRVVIVGGGAGGLELAIRLARSAKSRAEVTLIDRSPVHLWKPRLHEIAVGLLVTVDEEASFAEQAARHGFSFVLGEMQALDIVARRISLAPVPSPDRRVGGPDGLLPARTIEYDIVVLAMGSTINDFGTPGVKEHCYTLDSARDAQELHLSLLALAARVQAGEARSMHVAIVGAGTTGTELAAELRSAVRGLDAYRSLIDSGQVSITLIEMADRPISTADATTSARARQALAAQDVDMRFGAKVQAVTAGQLLLADQSHVDADLVVWASGIQGPPIVERLSALRVGKGRRIEVDGTLRAMSADGRRLENVYCLGDCSACFEDGATRPAGATAQVAEQQAQFLARSLVAQWQGRAAGQFHYRDRGTLVSLGQRFAVGDIPLPLPRSRAFDIEGPAAKLAYVALYRSHRLTLFGWWRTTLETLAGFLRRSALPAVKLRW